MLAATERSRARSVWIEGRAVRIEGRGVRRRMTARLVSPDRKLFLVAGEDDLLAVAELYNLTRQTERHSAAARLGWCGQPQRRPQ